MSRPTPTLPPLLPIPAFEDEEPTIAAPLALSEARGLENSRLFCPAAAPRQPLLAPLDPKPGPVGAGILVLAALWLLLGAGLVGRLVGVVDTSSIDSVAVADLGPVEDWMKRNGVDTDFADNLGIPRQLAATDEGPESAGTVGQIISVAVNDPDAGLSRQVVTDSTRANTTEEDPEVEETVSQPARAADRNDFTRAWAQWLGGEHSVTGLVSRQRVDGDAEPVLIQYRAARKGEASLDALGSSAVVTSTRGRQTCDRNRAGVMLCTPPTPVEDGDNLRAMSSLLDGPSPAYVIGAVDCPDDLCSESAVVASPVLADVNCWAATATSPNESHRWGQSTIFCFDPSSKAMVARQTTSTSRVESFVASVVRNQVDDRELQPR